jgi:hypothetical protein
MNKKFLTFVFLVCSLVFFESSHEVEAMTFERQKDLVTERIASQGYSQAFVPQVLAPEVAPLSRTLCTKFVCVSELYFFIGALLWSIEQTSVGTSMLQEICDLFVRSPDRISAPIIMHTNIATFKEDLRFIGSGKEPEVSYSNDWPMLYVNYLTATGIHSFVFMCGADNLKNHGYRSVQDINCNVVKYQSTWPKDAAMFHELVHLKQILRSIPMEELYDQNRLKHLAKTVAGLSKKDQLFSEFIRDYGTTDAELQAFIEEQRYTYNKYGYMQPTYCRYPNIPAKLKLRPYESLVLHHILES